MGTGVGKSVACELFCGVRSVGVHGGEMSAGFLRLVQNAGRGLLRKCLPFCLVPSGHRWVIYTGSKPRLENEDYYCCLALSLHSSCHVISEPQVDVIRYFLLMVFPMLR